MCLKIQPPYIGISSVIFLKPILEENISGDFLIVEKVINRFQVMPSLQVAHSNGDIGLGSVSF